MTRRIPCAVLGATGYVGQHFVRMLAGHPWFDLVAVTSSDRSTGSSLAESWQLPEPLPAEFKALRLTATSAAGVKKTGTELAFSALPSEVAGPLELGLSRRGVSVFSNAAAHRGDHDVPLLVPEVNPRHLSVLRHPRAGRGLFVTNPNCTATGLVVALKPVVDALAPRVVHVSTYQALSGAGFPGVASLSSIDNIVPFIASEEEKVARESTLILGTRSSAAERPVRFPVLANCARVPVRDGHLEAVTVEATGRPTEADLIRSWTTFDPLAPLQLPSAPHPPIVVRTEIDRPQPVRDRWEGSSERSRGMAVVIGRIRWRPPFLRFFLLSHNAVRGGAGGSILNAELACARGLLGSGSDRGPF